MTLDAYPTPAAGLTGRLAAFVHASAWCDLPEPVRHEARRSLMNYFAVALGGCSDPTISAAVRTFAPFSAGTHAGLIGRPECFDMLNAAALNAMMANVFDFDDTHIPTILHPTAPVAPALAALAQTRRVRGEDFLLAFVLGVEVECRIANAVSPWHYARGWHITSTCGVFGAAAASARILGLDARALAWAFGNASAQGAGLVETLGSSAKSISVGNAARNGLLSALLAQQGFEGPEAPLEGARGFLRVMGEQPDMAALEGSSAGWELLRNTYKPYPCGVVLNPVIDACLTLAGHPEVRNRTLGDVRKVELTGHPLLRQRTDRPAITTGRQSQVSAQHAVGVTLLRGRAGLEEFSDAAVQDAAVRALGATVRFVDDASMSVDGARVRISFADGFSVAEEVDFARGSLGRPMADGEIEQKLRDLCAYGGSGVSPSPLIDAVWHMDKSEDVGAIFSLASPAGA
jgi:2-methylcitrate dehydratase PrpD